MIPLSLRLRNFMSYGEGVHPLDFTAFHVACLSGENGHGKSALLDAMTWALWGKSRAKSEDDLVQLGKLDMEVELEFALGEDRYCVLRKRTLKASGRRRIGVPTLELQIFDGDVYRPLTGETVAQTQTIVQSILRIDYETFINSAFIVQGRADEFTLRSPAERKRVLADLLGLERYSDLEERAREEARRCQAERQTVLFEIAAIDAELGKRGQYEAELAQATERITRAEELQRLADAELRRWKEQQREAEQQAAQLEELKQRRAQAQVEITTLESHHANESSEVARLKKLVAQKVDVEAQVARLAELRARDETLSKVAAELLGLSQRRSELERAIAAAREGVVGRLELARNDLRALETLLESREPQDAALAEARRQLEALARVEEIRDRARAQLQEIEVEARARTDANVRLRAEMADIQEKLRVLEGAGATCPVCRGELTPEGRLALVDRWTADGKAKGDEFRANQGWLKRADQRREELTLALRAAEANVTHRARLRVQVETLQTDLAAAADSVKELPNVRNTVAQLAARLDAGGFLPAEEKELAALLSRIENASYDAGEHERLRGAIAGLRGAEALAAEVATAERGLSLAEQRLDETGQLLAARRGALVALDARLAELAADVERAAEVGRLVQKASEALDAAVRENAEAHKLFYAAQQRLDHCRYLDDQRVERVKAAERAGDERAIYDELAIAFGKKGIQAMIIESAIPEIEEEANELLARLTDGQLSLTFETQREAKFGDSVIETLDIRISDSYGTRNYELYSGGEAFRVNFAIRVALSKLLTRRAGAQLQLLVIDEGFGTQDTTGRDRLVEAINAVTSEFEKILVVTHIQELKDAFPVRIDVVKGPEGSQIAATSVLDG